jgi:hypothetical protein
MFTLTINCSALYQTKENLILLKKLYKINKGKFGKIIINIIDNYKRDGGNIVYLFSPFN